MDHAPVLVGVVFPGCQNCSIKDIARYCTTHPPILPK
jgi:hypothetical protein